MTVDKRFTHQVNRWEADFSSFNDSIIEVQPPASVYAALERRMFGTEPAPKGLLISLWGSVEVWRGLTVASLLALLTVGAYPLFQARLGQEERPLIAELSGTNTPFNLAVSYDTARGQLRLMPIALRQPEPRSLEVWVIEDGKAPRSVGLLPDDGTGEFLVKDDARQYFAEGMTIAITVEPLGGAPGGNPTGPVIAAGKTRLL